MKQRTGLIKLFFIALLILISSCKKEDSPAEPEDNGSTTTDWKVGETKTYTVATTANSKIEDNLTGKTFSFPEGGGGQFSVSKIVSGPSTISSDNVFSINFSGTSKIQVVQKGTAKDDYIVGYVPILDNGILIDDGKTDAVWMPIMETDNGDGTLTFTLPYKKKVSKTLWQGSEYYKSINMKDLPEKTRFETMIREAANTLINAVPDARKQKVMDDVNGPLMPQLYVNTDVKTPCYKPFWDFWGIGTRKIFMFNPKNDKGNVAHEVGHYFHHVLLGSGYTSFANWPRGNILNLWSHGIGTKGSKYNIIEEPAYFSEYFLYGKIKAWNPEDGDFLVDNREAIPSYKNSPEKDDWMDLEGAGIAMIASLIKSNTTVTDYKGRSVKVPIINSLADKTPMFKDVYEIIAGGVSSLPDLRDKLLTLVATKWSGIDKVPVIWQAMGYSYHAKMKFVDKDNKAISGVTAQSLMKVDGDEYLLAKTDKETTTDGIYTLAEVYPGNSWLRVYYTKDGNKVQKDIEVNKIGWDYQTNTEIDLGDIQLEQESLLPYLQKTIVCGVQFEGRCNFTDGSVYPFKKLIDNNSSGKPIEWSGQSFSMSKTWTTMDGPYNKYEKTLSIAGSVSADGRSVVSATAIYEEKWYEVSPSTGASSLLRTIKEKIVANNLPNTLAKADNKSFGYAVVGVNTQQKLGAFEYSEVWTTGYSLIYSSTKWDDASVSPSLVVIFMAP